MSEANETIPEAANNDANEVAENENQELVDGAELETTTPEEVAEVLKNSGMKVSTPVATDSDDEKPEETPDEVETPTDEEEITDEELDGVETDDESEIIASDQPDFSFEVEDAEGVTHKISPDDKMEDVLADFTPKNNGQIIDILNQLREAKENQKQHANDEATKAEEAEKAQNIEDIQQGWQEEFKSLKITDEARQNAIFAHMKQENDKRQEENKPLIRTVEYAKLSLEAQERDAEAKAAVKAEKDTARKNGSLIGGSSAPATAPTPQYRPGSASNASEAIRAMGLA